MKKILNYASVLIMTLFFSCGGSDEDHQLGVIHDPDPANLLKTTGPKPWGLLKYPEPTNSKTIMYVNTRNFNFKKGDKICVSVKNRTIDGYTVTYGKDVFLRKSDGTCSH